MDKLTYISARKIIYDEKAKKSANIPFPPQEVPLANTTPRG
jgi:hypothetical protein